jgi:hypothetical protein
MRRAGAIALLLLPLAAGCHRPVDGRTLGSTLITRIDVAPKFVRAGVEIAVELRISGAPPVSAVLEIAGVRTDCTPERLGEGRYRCQHPGLDPARYPPGSTLVVAEVADDRGRTSLATEPITIDYECPRIVTLTAERGAITVLDAGGERTYISSVGGELVLGLESSEDLGQPPQVSRNGARFGELIGDGRSFKIRTALTDTDAASPAPVVVRLFDLAGNSSGDCADDGRLMLAVDHDPPVADLSRVSLIRDAPGLPSTITASTGAFADDVAIKEVRIYDDQGAALLASFTPHLDGSLPPTSLRLQPSSRVLVEVVDHLGRSNGRASRCAPRSVTRRGTPRA